MESNPDEAIAWASDRGEVKERDAALEIVAQIHGNKDPRQAADLALTEQVAGG